MLPSHQQKLDATGARHGQRFGDGDLAREAVTRPPKKNEGWNSDRSGREGRDFPPVHANFGEGKKYR